MAGLADLTTAVHRLADLLERSVPEGLGDEQEPLYNAAPSLSDEMVDEATMAEQLDIPERTLGKYRRQGKFPGCWLKNGRRIRWRIYQTTEAWKRGIA